MQKNKTILTGHLVTTAALGIALTVPTFLTSPAEARPNDRASQQRRAAERRNDNLQREKAERARLLALQRNRELQLERNRIQQAQDARSRAVAEAKQDELARRRVEALQRQRRDALARQRSKALQQQRIEAQQRRRTEALARQRRVALQRNNNRNNNNDRQTIMRGIVTRDLPGDRFAMRSYSGRNFTVILTDGEREPRSLNKGSRVQVGGYFHGNTFYAYDVNV